MQNAKVVIPLYIEHVEMSKSQRATYYKKGDKKIPKKYQTDMYAFDGKGRLYSLEIRQFVIKNAKKAGTPRLWKINGQGLWNGEIERFTRIKIAEEMHAYFEDIIILNLPDKIEIPEGQYLHLEYIFYRDDLDHAHTQDLWNHSVLFTKVFEDSLAKLKVIPDDNPKYIRGSYVHYEPLAKGEDRVLVINFHFKS